MRKLKTAFVELMQDESGQSMIEYALIAALIGVVAVTFMSNIGTAINSKFSTIASQLTSA